jgi:hypothetical protein
LRHNMKRDYTQLRRSSSERGQVFLAIVIFIAMFLLAVVGLATDYTQVWAHRQMAQGAADAACQAAAADLFLKGTDPNAATDFPTFDFSWIGNTFDCTTHTSSSPCKYASFNGYSGSAVKVEFPSTVSGAGTIPAGITITNPYIKVTITDPVGMLFTKIVSPLTTFNVKASASCGLNPINTPVPLVVLHRSASPSLQVGGSASITILGGPQRSIQVDSSSATAVNAGTVDLSHAGPASPPTGGDFALFGGPTTKPGAVNVGTTGHWIPGANPFGDPFASVTAPTRPATAGTATPVPFGFNGCPDPAGCVEFTAGDYTGCSTGSTAPGGKPCLNFPFAGSNPSFSLFGTDWQPNHVYTVGTVINPRTTTCPSNTSHFAYIAIIGGMSSGTCPALTTTRCTRQPDGTCTLGTTTDGAVTWQNIGVTTASPSTAIFDPGLYYLAANGLSFGSGSTARISTATGDGSKGIMFYFSATDSLAIGSSSGSASACTSVGYPYNSGTPSGCIVAYKIDGTLSSAATGYVGSPQLRCPSGSTNPSQVPATLAGSILLGPCGNTSGIGASGQYGSPDSNRGFLFFQSRSLAANGGTCTGGGGGRCAILGGGGSFIFSGFIYLHKGNGATCGTDTSCLTLSGGSGGNSFTIGNIVVDEISMVGSSGVTMILNPSATFSVLRPTLLQ